MEVLEIFRVVDSDNVDESIKHDYLMRKLPIGYRYLRIEHRTHVTSPANHEFDVYMSDNKGDPVIIFAGTRVMLRTYSGYEEFISMIDFKFENFVEKQGKSIFIN